MSSAVWQARLELVQSLLGLSGVSNGAVGLNEGLYCHGVMNYSIAYHAQNE